MYIFHRSHALFCSLASSLSFRNSPQILQQCRFSHPPDIVSISSSAQSLKQVHQAHAQALIHGFLPFSVSVSSALILRYALFRSSPKTVQYLFSQSVAFALSPFLYNTIIRANGVLGICDFVVYNEMLRSGVVPDDHTFGFVLKLCSDFSEVRKGLEVHGGLIKFGFDSDVFVNNTLLMFYGSSGDLFAARKVFDEMPEKDSVSWNSMVRVYSENNCCLDAIRVFKDMFWSGVKPNSVSVVSTLPVCAAVEYRKMGSEIHCYAFKVGLDTQISIGNALVDAYGKCGDVEASKQVFDEMIERNDVSWNTRISTLAYNECYEQAFSCFRSMIKEEAVDFNCTTVSSVLPILTELGYFCNGREVHGLCVRTGLDRDVFVANSLIDMYSKFERSTEASNVFYNTNTRNAISWNAMIANFAQNSLELEAIALVREMQAQGENLTFVTFTNVLPACARLGCVRPGKEIHAKSLRCGSASDLFVSNALIDMYAKCGYLNLAQNVFNISPRDEVSYNILIVGYSLTSDWSESLALFSEMGRLGMKYDIVSIVGILSACANFSAIKQGKEIHCFAIRRLFHEHQFISNSLLDLYTKCGQIDISRKIFDRMRCRDTASWNTMILGYGMIGEVETALGFFESMKDDGVEYDSVSYLSVLSACSHGGFIEKGRKYFDDMFARDIKPKQTHYACMVDLLGRCGLIDEAVHLVQSLPIEADANIWGALLGACRLHGKLELGCWAADNLIRLKPNHSGYYALLSNMYAEAGKWKEADSVRELMKLKGVKKTPGCSWVQMKDRAYGFVSGERFEQLDSCSWLENAD